MSTGKYGTSRPETEALLAFLNNPGDPDGAYALQILEGMSRDERHRLRRVCEQIEGMVAALNEAEDGV